MNTQPTNDELGQALMFFFLAADEFAARRAVLAEMRDRRTTWYDSYELGLRRSIDEALTDKP